jgi:tRNA pseudouridine13 synthase
MTANRFEVTVRDLSPSEAARGAEGAAEVERVGVVNYFDSQRFGFLKHGQGFLARHLVRGDWEAALKAFLATPSELDRSDDAKVKAFWRDHWGEWQLRAPHDAARRYAPLLRRLRDCERLRHHVVNLVAVNFYARGALLRAVDTLNGVR